MPWAGVDFPPLGVATLKAYLETHQVKVDCLHLNLRFAAHLPELGNPLMLLRRWNVWAEWFFGYYLFGPGGMKEIPGNLKSIIQQPNFKEFLKKFELDEMRAEKLLKELVPKFMEECLRDIPWTDYDLIGFSSIFCSHVPCLALSQKIKTRFPTIPIVFGGSNVEGEMGAATLKGCEWIDYVVDGEGEEALLSLVQSIQSGKPFENIPGISYRKGSEIIFSKPEIRPPFDLDKLPVPDHRDFFKEIKRSGFERWLKPEVTFEASRGCWWGQKQHCTFCGLNGKQMNFRTKKPELVLRDILELHRRHQTLNLRAVDNILGIDHLRDLVPLISETRKKYQLNLTIDWEIKSNIDPEKISQLAEVGTRNLQPGIESLSTPILKLMRKGVRGIQNVQFLKSASENGILTIWNIIGGFYGENPQDYEQMAITALSLTHLTPPGGCSPIRVDRFSPYHFDFKSLGVEKPRPMEVYAYIYPKSRFKMQEIAYFFEMNRPPNTPDPNIYMAPIKEVTDFWTRIWPKNFFTYKQGQGFIDLYDSRPLKIEGGTEYREYRLEGVEAFVFTYCKVLRGIGQITDSIKKEGFPITANQLNTILNNFIHRKWMLREDNFYLTLATNAGLTASQQLSFERMARLHKSYLPPAKPQPTETH